MKNKKGFTLVELLVVIAILAILATVSIVGYTGFIKKAKESNATVELTQIRDLMIAADIDDSVVYDEYKLTTDTTVTTGKKYYAKVTDGQYAVVGAEVLAGEGYNPQTANCYEKETKRTDLSDGIETLEEAEALWNEIEDECEGLKGKLFYKSAGTDGYTLIYVLDTAEATLNPKTGDIKVSTPVAADLTKAGEGVDQLYAPAA